MCVYKTRFYLHFYGPRIGAPIVDLIDGARRTKDPSAALRGALDANTAWYRAGFVFGFDRHGRVLVLIRDTFTVQTDALLPRAYFLALLLWHTTRAHGSQSDLTSRFTALASLAAHAVLPDRGVNNLGGAFSEMGVPVESEYIGGGGSSKADRDGGDMSSMFKDIFVPWTVGVDSPWDLSSSSHTFYNEGWTLASVSGKEE